MLFQIYNIEIRINIFDIVSHKLKETFSNLFAAMQHSTLYVLSNINNVFGVF